MPGRRAGSPAGAREDGGGRSPAPTRAAFRRLEPTTAKGKAGGPTAADRVLVAVRVRPFLAGSDGRDGARQAVFPDSAMNAVECGEAVKGRKVHQFDYVFAAEQDEIHDCIGKQMLREAFNGFNVCLFAYGQTGSGKTYTIQGLPGAGLPRDGPHDAAKEGVVPRVCKDLFAVVQDLLEEDEELDIKVTLSFAEVYNEKIRDLLPSAKLPRGAEPPSLDIHETADHKIEVPGLTKHTVRSADRVVELMHRGNSNRQVAETKMNECSSRSHSILQLHMVQRYETPSPEKRDCESLINIVDLAGSERQSKTGAQGDTFQEAKHINQSLLMLGRALSSFSDGGKAVTHVPLRESKLTRLLSQSFGGNSKTWMLATASPSSFNLQETVCTLNYASAAKNITNTAKQNKLQRAMEMQELKQMNHMLEESLDKAKKEVEDQRRKIDQLLREIAKCDPAAVAALEKENRELRRENEEMQMELQQNKGFREQAARTQQEKARVESDLETIRKQMEAGVTPRTARSCGPHPSGLTVPQSGMYIGRAKVSLRNIIDQTSNYLTLPLANESGVEDARAAVLVVNIYPVDAKGSAALDKRQASASAERDLLGQRVDFVVHIISAKAIPKRYSSTVYCKYVYKWAEKDSYKTTEVRNSVDPEFDFKKRFAFSKMNAGLVEYFRSDNVITFEVIGVETSRAAQGQETAVESNEGQ